MHIERSQRKYRISKFLWNEQNILLLNFRWYGLFNLFFKNIFYLSYKRNNVHSGDVYEPITGFYRWFNAEVEADALITAGAIYDFIYYSAVEH